MITYRATQESDIPIILQIVRQAQEYFKNNDINQWQNGYPNQEIFMHDLKMKNSYVFLQNNEIIATAMISFDGESTYDQIDGEWLNDNLYAVIHRVVVKNQYKGQNIAGEIFNVAKSLCQGRKIANIRVDTHRKNIPMQRVLEKWGFHYCGTIFLKDGAERIAYHWADK